MLIDDITITVKAGNGGDGAVTFHPMRGGPSGGNGGKGGDVYLIGVNDIDALSQFKFKKELKAKDGESGGRQDKDGRNSDDLYIKVPIGTRIAINDSDWIWETEDTHTPFLVAKGGKGGLGNDEFKSATNQTPRYAEKGQKGQEKKVHLQLRLIADIGLIGLPNAGKSSLLQVLTKANPKIGDYPFTTLEPNLGVCFTPNKNLILADIPGLIEGASTGRGLGIKFLKHIEKTNLLAHCIDISQENLNHAYTTVRKEFEQYNPELLKKEEIIILTKTDLLDKKEIEKKIKNFRSCHSREGGSPDPSKHKVIVPVSIIDDESLKNLKKILI
jgi:GTP-binding protein